MLIAIDGYNFIKQVPELRRLEEVELQKAREKLIEELARYKRLKGYAVTVVFDGRQEGALTGNRERVRGIEVIFSRPGEKADDVLKRICDEKRGGALVVTSDREVALYAEKKGAAVLPVAAFAEKLQAASIYDLKGSGGESPPDRPIAPAKKGPSRRLSKSRRRSAAVFKKL